MKKKGPHPETNPMAHEESYIEYLRQAIVNGYKNHPTGCGDSFGELLCYEIHTNGLTFCWLAEKWGLSLPTLGALIHNHCVRLERLPHINHDWKLDESASDD